MAPLARRIFASMWYRLFRPLLFALEPERAHALTLRALRVAQRVGVLSSSGEITDVAAPVTLMGLQFPNRIGIAAGLDKNGVCIDALGALGVGCVEVGTVTPRPQPGNPPPRIFRLTRARALINRMGFPNDGVEALCERLQARTFRGICGVNIGKNAATPLANATQDYVACLKSVAPFADYVTVNVSSPNTAGLRSLQSSNSLKPMLQALLAERERLPRRLPLLVKIAPDLEDEALSELAALLRELNIDGVIATNTTLRRDTGLGARGAEQGGLSGAPLRALSLEVVRKLRGMLGPHFPIVGVGGIASLADAQAMRAAGADLVQIYTGLIYEGPGLITALRRGLRD